MLAERIKAKTEEKKKRSRYGLSERQREVAARLREELHWARLEASLSFSNGRKAV